MRIYSRHEIQTLLGISEHFFVALESEEIVIVDAPEQQGYSERMLERARVASNLVDELDVNLPGAAIIVRMREEMAVLRRDVTLLAEELRRVGRR